MNKTLLCNLDLLRRKFGGVSEDENKAIEEFRDTFLRMLDGFLDGQKNQVLFFSRDQNDLKAAQDAFDSVHPLYRYATREQVKNLLQEGENTEYLFVSNKDIDFQMAVRFRVLLVVPLWIPHEDKAEYYGITVDIPEQLFQFVQVLNNHNFWHSTWHIDDHSVALSLMDARYKKYAWTTNEQEMMQHFEHLLKQGRSRSYYKILLYHFLSGMTNTDLFDDIELFGIIPSSDCTLNPDMLDFMQQVRYIKGKRLPHNRMHCDNLLIRAFSKEKAHETDSSIRAQRGPEVEFSTLCLNAEFAEKIHRLKRTGRFNVCIFDDYMTFGNSFNAVRNILNHLGANKIVFVSLGNFGRPFERWDYDIQGNVFDIGYDYRLISKTQLQPEYNYRAKEEVDALYEIYNTEQRRG